MQTKCQETRNPSGATSLRGGRKCYTCDSDIRSTCDLCAEKEGKEEESEEVAKERAFPFSVGERVAESWP